LNAKFTANGALPHQKSANLCKNTTISPNQSAPNTQWAIVIRRGTNQYKQCSNQGN